MCGKLLETGLRALDFCVYWVNNPNYPVDTTDTIDSIINTLARSICNTPIESIRFRIMPAETKDWEIEVTPEMIEAGLKILYTSGAIENPILENDRSLIQKIFFAMIRRQVENP